MKMVVARRGAPTGAIDLQPAFETPVTRETEEKLHNCKPAVLGSPRAVVIGRRMKGRGHHGRMTKTLKKRWRREIEA